MINLLQMQDKLKDMSDRQLASEMQSGMVPQYLVLSELQRRQKMRQTAKMSQQGQQPQTTVADDLEAAEMGADEGVAALPIQEPQFASGGIVSFADGGGINAPWWSPEYARAAEASGLSGLELEELRRKATGNPNDVVRSILLGGTSGAQRDKEQKPAVSNKPANAPAMPPAPPAPPAPAQDQTKLQPPAADKNTPKETPTGGDKLTPAGMGWTSIYPTLNEGVGAYPTLKTEAQDKAAEELLAKYEKNKAGAADQAMIAAGLAMMAGKSPYAMQNIGAGGIEGLKAYKQEQKDLDELQKGILGIGTKKEEAENLRAQAEYKAKADERLLKAGLYRGEQKILSDEYIAELHRRAQTDQYARQELKERNDFLQSNLAELARAALTEIDPTRKKAINNQQAEVMLQVNRLNPGTFSDEAIRSLRGGSGRVVQGPDNVVRRQQ